MASVKPYKVFDGHGLYLEVLPSGTKSWRLKYYSSGKASIETFGHWPIISIASARKIALEFRTNLQNNNGVNLQWAPKTFKDLADEWGDKFLTTLSQKEKKTKKSFLKRFILPELGNVSLQDITPRLILEKVLRPVEERGALQTVKKINCNSQKSCDHMLESPVTGRLSHGSKQ
jgi:hypothetical protein